MVRVCNIVYFQCVALFLIVITLFELNLSFFCNIIDYNWTRQKIDEKYLTKR